MISVKESIKSFVSYKPNTQSYTVKLDANESRVNETIIYDEMVLKNINRYPDNYAVELRNEIAKKNNIEMEEVLVGNGSSELLELVIKTVINPGDIVLSITPSFVMYKKYTMLSNGVYKTVPTSEKYETVVADLIEAAKQYQPKIIMLCTPNNPTGFMLSKEEVLKVVSTVDAIVVVDEAYMEFATTNESVIPYINQYDNLIVNRTFSKAYALAGIRLGYFILNSNLASLLSIAKTPYGVNTISQRIGIAALQDETYVMENVTMIQEERQRVNDALVKFGCQTYQSEGNFIFCKTQTIDLATALSNKGVLIRDFKNSTYRITIGTPNENTILINALEEIKNERK